MTDVEFRSDMTVELLDFGGGDAAIIEAMLVSTQADKALDAKADFGRINFLMKNRHGTPFEHTWMKFYIEAPIFVFREFHRHRIGWSYNEVSGRYRELDPVFYVPGHDRPLVQQGKPGAYEFVPGSMTQLQSTQEAIIDSCNVAYVKYKYLLAEGVAKEVARMVLPVNTYSAMVASCNTRSMMAFLSLRTRDENALFPSKPMTEIDMVARSMEQHFEALFPDTWQAFNDNGRVSP